MSATIRTRRFGTLFSVAIAAALFGGFTVPSAKAGNAPYLGWDFGGGFGVGVGAPPSAYDPCPTYGWPAYPYRCRYYRPIYHYRHHPHRYYRHYYR